MAEIKEIQYTGMNMGALGTTTYPTASDPVPMTYGNNYSAGQSNMSPLARFLLGLFTGVAAAAPVTALITNAINKKREAKAVQQAYIRGEDNGIAAYTVLIKGEIAKGTVIIMPQASSALMDRVNSVTSDDGSGENGTDGSGATGADSCANRSSATASSSQVIEKTNEGDYIDPPVYVESAYTPGTYTRYIPDEREMQRNRDVRANSYFGVIEDPDARAQFEAQMASMEAPTDEDINNYDLTIDDEEATQEASEFTESRVEYLDMIRAYKNVNGNIPPMTISREQFDNEHRLEKSYVNWYDEDDVFEENDRKIDDPYYTFGFVSGKDMFSPDRVALREDPEICHVRNLKLSTDFEITRTHGSYSKLIADGEVYYRGEAITDI